MEGVGKKDRVFAHCLCAGVALALEQSHTWLLNTSLFARYDALFPEARDISMVALALASLALTALAARRSAAFSGKIAPVLFLASFLAGVALSLAGVAFGSAPLAVAGSLLRAIGLMWPFLLIGLALMSLDGSRALLAVCWGFVGGYACMALMAPLSYETRLLLYVALPFVVVALVAPWGRGTLAAMGESDSRMNLSVTSPRSFLPFTHALFFAIAAFNAAYGFALCFEAVASMPQSAPLAIVPLLVVALTGTVRRRIPLDGLYQGACLLVLAGLLCVLSISAGAPSGEVPWTQTLLSAGSKCFDLLVWFVMARLAARNLAGALPMFLALFTAQVLGLVAGAGLGHGVELLIALNQASACTLVMGAILLFAGYNLITLKSFSFEATLRQVVPMKSVFAGVAPATVEELCHKAAERYGLTPRETEIAELLARGRNTQAIQDKLVVSRNTVKTHVKNIYAKLGVHSQQDLIDCIERIS